MLSHNVSTNNLTNISQIKIELLKYLQYHNYSSITSISIQILRSQLKLYPYYSSYITQDVIFKEMINLLNNDCYIVRFETLDIMVNNLSIIINFSKPLIPVLEVLLCDPNKYISSNAIIILLKLSTENEIDRIIKSLMSNKLEIKDSFKIQVNNMLTEKSLQYPSKIDTILFYLTSKLRDDGSLIFKSNILDNIEEILPQTKEIDKHILQLCEFIEDSEYPQLSCKVIGLLGRNCKKLYEQIIRVLFNRLMLENALVRYTVINTFVSIAKQLPSQSNDILNIINYVQDDPDDLVRDRISVAKTELNDENCEINFDKIPQLDNLYRYPQQIFSNLTKSIENNDESNIIDCINDISVQAGDFQSQEQSFQATTGPTAADISTIIPENLLDYIGRQLNELSTHNLTDSDAECNVSVNIQLYERALLLEFDVLNTMKNIEIMNVQIELRKLDTNVLYHSENIQSISINKLEKYYILLDLNQEKTDSYQLRFSPKISFTLKSTHDMFEDENILNEFNISDSIFFAPLKIDEKEFNHFWNEFPFTKTEKFSLGKVGLHKAVSIIIDITNTFPILNSDDIKSTTNHKLYICGKHVFTNQVVLLECLLAITRDESTIIKVTAKSTNAEIINTIIDILENY